MNEAPTECELCGTDMEFIHLSVVRGNLVGVCVDCCDCCSTDSKTDDSSLLDRLRL